jgi:hypothetical protein
MRHINFQTLRCRISWPLFVLSLFKRKEQVSNLCRAGVVGRFFKGNNWLPYLRCRCSWPLLQRKTANFHPLRGADVLHYFFNGNNTFSSLAAPMCLAYFYKRERQPAPQTCCACVLGCFFKVGRNISFENMRCRCP